MPNLFWLLLAAILFFIAWQDFKHRAIYWWLPVLLFVAGIVYDIKQGVFFEPILSLGLITFQLTIIYSYFYFRKGPPFINQEILGLGDVLTLLAFAPFFNSWFMLIFLISGFSISAISYFILSQFSHKYKTVPLAGLMSLCFIPFFILCKIILKFNLLSDYPLL